MPLEVAQYINTLNPANPVGSDPLSSADDHIRLIKQVLQNTFPNIDSAVTVTDNQLNELPSRVSALEAGGGGGGGGGGTPINTTTGLEFVSTLPGTGEYIGQMVYLSTDGLIYAWTGSAWEPVTTSFTLNDVPPAVKIVDGLPSTATDGEVVLNTVDNKLYERVNGAWVELTFTVNAAQEVADASITVAKFAQGLRPVEIVNSLPTANNVEGRLVYLTTDDKLYRFTGTSFVTGMPFGDLTGTIGADQIAANSITGGKIQAGAISANQIATGGIIATNLAAGAVTAEKITAAAITADKIATNAITSDKIASNAIIAGKISAGAIGTTELAAGAITAEKLSTGTLLTNSAQIANGIIIAAKIGDAQVGTLKIAGNAVTQASVFQSAGDLGDSAGGGGTTIVSGTITTSGTQPILVTFSSFIGGGLSAGSLNSSLANINVTISLAGVTQFVIPSLTVPGGQLTCGTGAVLFSGIPAGTYTVSASLSCDAGSGVTGAFARNPTLIVLETKR